MVRKDGLSKFVFGKDISSSVSNKLKKTQKNLDKELSKVIRKQHEVLKKLAEA